ncbi:MAG: methyltransferase FkbM [Bacteroidetes bacterium]|nr:MAG: methyltransferase FkbM [Bacteroidota bacterium]
MRGINKLLDSFGYSLYKKSFHEKKYIEKRDFRPLEQLFYRHLHPDFYFVQIGANDGVSFDPIYELVMREQLRGIALEPLPDIFLKLQENYAGNPRVELVNAAIHKNEKQLPIYRVDPKAGGLPEWVKGIGSFNKDHHKLSQIDSGLIITETVQCMSLPELIDSYAISHIDLLQIDTEGYDCEIIAMIDFSVMKPGIISFEHGIHDGIMSYEGYQHCQRLLMDQGYEIMTLKRDAIAYLRNW